MSSASAPEDRRNGARRSHLRLLADPRTASALQLPREERRSEQAVEHRPHKRARILVVGADPERRAAVLRDLSEELPADTQFEEAAAVAEVLDQAPSSGVVMLTGDLGEITAESLMHVLGDRHPSLPVIALGVRTSGVPARA